MCCAKCCASPFAPRRQVQPSRLASSRALISSSQCCLPCRPGTLSESNFIPYSLCKKAVGQVNSEHKGKGRGRGKLHDPQTSAPGRSPGGGVAVRLKALPPSAERASLLFTPRLAVSPWGLWLLGLRLLLAREAAPDSTSSVHFLRSAEGGRFVWCSPRAEEGRWGARAGPWPHHRAAHAQCSPPSPSPASPPPTGVSSHPPTPSTPAYRQPDQGHQGHSHCSFTSWRKRTCKCRNHQNQRATTLALPCLGPTRVRAQHRLRLVTQSIHISVPLGALAEACPVFIRTPSALGLLKSCSRERSHPSMFRIKAIRFAPPGGLLLCLLLRTSQWP